mgnify:FL=1
MISQIRGKLIEVEDDKVVVDVGGVGYEIEVASSVLDMLPVDEDQEISLVCHFVVREDAQLLYGFSSKEERSLFRAYIRINGVGPRLGLALLSSLSMNDLSHIVDQNDVGLLQKVPGVGKKTAERLLVELKNQLGDLLKLQSYQGHAQDKVAGSASLAREAGEALIALGYKQQESNEAVTRALTEVSDHTSLTLNELVRLALRNFIRE